MSLSETMLRAQPQKFGLWPSVWKLLRLRVRIWWNGLRRAKLRSKIGTGIVALLLVGMMVFLFFLSGLLLRFLQSPQLAALIDPQPLLRALPTLVLTSAFFLIVVTNFGVLLQSLYLSHDMDFLIASPIPMRAVFLAKLLEAILPNFGLFCAFTLPVLFGIGLSSGYNILYYPLLLVMLAVLALAAGGLASILVMAIVRVVPARRVAEVLGFFGAIASILCGQSGNLISAMRPGQTEVAGALNLFTRLNTPWSPLAWAGRGLDAIGHAEWLPGLPLALLSLALAGAVFGGTLLLVERLYYSGWASMQGTARRKRGARNGKGAKAASAPSAPARTSAAAVPNAVVEAPARKLGNPFYALLPRRVRGLVAKDFLLLRRDPRNMSQLITPLILGFVMLFTTRGGARAAWESVSSAGFDLRTIEVYGLMVLAVFVGWMLMFNLATLAFSREGRSYWMIKSAPLRPRQLLASKFIVSYLPALLFSLGYLVLAFLIRGADWAFLPYTALVMAVSMAGATGIALTFGVAGAKLDWDNPRHQRLSGATGCFVFLAVVGFMGLDLALFLLPPILWQVLGNRVAFFAGGPLPGYLTGALLGIAASAVVIAVTMAMAAPRLARIGEAE